MAIGNDIKNFEITDSWQEFTQPCIFILLSNERVYSQVGLPNTPPPATDFSGAPLVPLKTNRFNLSGKSLYLKAYKDEAAVYIEEL